MGIDLGKQLSLLKMATHKYGSTHDAQLLQIKLYPRMIPNVERGTVANVDLDAKLVRYTLKVNKKFRRTKIVERYFSSIVQWVRSVWWSDADVVFELDSRVIFDSRINK
jgi:hypothetical protein